MAVTPKPITANTLFYGDNLAILREYVPSESVDLVYLDPPFNSKRDYNTFLTEETGGVSEAQIKAFKDTWYWDVEAVATYEALIANAPVDVSALIGAFRRFLGASPMMAYTVMMTARLIELHRVLKPTGSLYLHCDPTVSPHLRLVLDAVFGPKSYRNEFVWKRSSAHNDSKQGAKQGGRIHDVLLFYTKDEKKWTWNPMFTAYKSDYVASNYRHVETETGRRFKSTDLTAAKPGGDTSYDWKGRKPPKNRYWAYSQDNMQKFEKEGRLYYTKTGLPRLKQYLDDMPDIPIQDVWDDIPPLSAHAAERLGYPTQKPVALLKRIIEVSSQPGDVVLDPFCGCGTTIVAAEQLKRRWIGIDITHIAIALQKYQLSRYSNSVYEVIGEPRDVASARKLALDNRFQFQYWAVALVNGKPIGGEEGSKRGKQGKDRGIDGVITFIDGAAGETAQALIQVKSGKAQSSDIRDFRGTLEREKAAIGLFITLQAATPEMRLEAANASVYKPPLWTDTYPRIQILSIEDLLNGATPKLPPSQKLAGKPVVRPDASAAEQPPLDL